MTHQTVYSLLDIFDISDMRFVFNTELFTTVIGDEVTLRQN